MTSNTSEHSMTGRCTAQHPNVATRHQRPTQRHDTTRHVGLPCRRPLAHHVPQPYGALLNAPTRPGHCPACCHDLGARSTPLRFMLLWTLQPTTTHLTVNNTEWHLMIDQRRTPMTQCTRSTNQRTSFAHVTFVVHHADNDQC